MAAAERNKLYREKKAILEKLEPVEGAIENGEARRVEIAELLCDPSILADSRRIQSLMIELKNIETELAGLVPQWEALAAELETMTD